MDYLTFLKLSQLLDIQISIYFFSVYAPCDVILPTCAPKMTLMAEVALEQTANHVGVYIVLDIVGTEVTL